MNASCYKTDKLLVWVGSKLQNSEFIVDHVPLGISELVSPFFGSGAVELALLRSRSGLRIRASDLDHSLIGFWKAMVSIPKDVAKHVARLFPKCQISKDMFQNILTTHSKNSQDLASADQAINAARFWMINHLCFNGKMSKHISFNKLVAERISRNRDARISSLRGYVLEDSCRLSLEVHDAFEVIESSATDTMLLLDPPYLVDMPEDRTNKGPGPKGKVCGKCGRCGREFKFYRSLEKHIASCAADPSGEECRVQWICQACGEECGCKSAWEKHVKSMSCQVAQPYKRLRGNEAMYACGPNWGMELHNKLHKLLAGRSKWILCHQFDSRILALYADYHIIEYVQGQTAFMTGRTSGRKELLILSPWVSAELARSNATPELQDSPSSLRNVRRRLNSKSSGTA